MTVSRSISVTRLIPAAPSRIFELPADPRQHARFDSSDSVTSVKRAPARLALGSTVSVRMKTQVVVFEDNRAVAWHHFAKFDWRYDLEEVSAGTLVTESFNYDRPWAFVIIALGFPERNRAAMRASLERVELLVTS